MVILPNMAKTVKRPLFHYFFAFFHILRCPYHGFSGHRVFLTHFWGCMRGGLWVLCAEVQKSQNASPVLKVLPPPTPPPPPPPGCVIRKVAWGLGSGLLGFGGFFIVIFVIYPCIGYGFIFCENFSH